MITGPRNYARIALDYYEDAVLAACADECAAATHLWPILVCMARAVSDEASNPHGVIECAPSKLAYAIRGTQNDVIKALELMADGKLILLLKPSRGVVRITLTKFDYWQVPRFSDAEKKQMKRDASREAFAGENIAKVPLESPLSPPIVPLNPDPDPDPDPIAGALKASSTTDCLAREGAPARAAETLEWMESMQNRLRPVLAGEVVAVAEQVEMYSRRPHPTTKMRYPPKQWDRAVDRFVDYVKGGKAVDRPMGLILKMVPDAIDVEAVKHQTPDTRYRVFSEDDE